MTATPFSIRGSVLQVSVTGPAGTPVELLDGEGQVVRSGTIDHFGDRLILADLGVTDSLEGRGGLVFRHLDPGVYILALGDAGSGRDGAREEVTVTVLDPFVLPDDFDDRVRGQRLGPGYGYLEVRDGALLSVNVSLPDPVVWGDGPHPTVVQYSGYNDTRPGFLTGDPAHDVHLNTEANLALHLGYAVVGLAQRGTGGSEGSFLLFEPIQGTDGHDAIEAIAAQDWVARRGDGTPALGMLGRSMPGYTQLLTASFGPPSLAAITPAAVGARPLGSAGRPGGIPNVSMARGIAGWQVDPIEPINGVPQQQPPRYASGGWDDWVPAQVAGGDELCARNQLLRGQNVDAVPAWTGLEHEDGGILVHADAEVWAQSVTVPTLLIGTWQDQLSGPWFSDLIERFPADTQLRVVAFNGAHEETRLPLGIAAWAEFLSLFVREQPPEWTDAAQAYLDAVLGDQYPDGIPVSFDRYQGLSFEAARAAYLARPPILVAMENGAAPGHPAGYPYAPFTVGFGQWPPQEARPERWYLGVDGSLAPGPASPAAPPARFHYGSSDRPRVAGGDGFDANGPNPVYDWRPPHPDRSLQFVTPPLDAGLLVVGPSSLDLWVRATVDDLDLEVTLSEVRPDGWETYVQAGWLRASCRALDPALTTELRPRLSYRAADAAPLPADGFTLVRVPIGGVGHHLRQGSRLAVTVAAPGGTQLVWDLEPLHRDGLDAEGDDVVVQVALGGDAASSLVVPCIRTWTPIEGRIPAELPAVGALRLQPSRRWGPDQGTGAEADPAGEPAPSPPGEPADGASGAAPDPRARGSFAARALALVTSRRGR